MNDPKRGPQETFTEDHRACDAAYAELETALDGGEVERYRAAWKSFEAKMSRHFAMEEELLFPAIEDRTGMRGMGPTEIMRREHQEMRGLLRQIAAAVAAGDVDRALGAGDTLLMVIQQHNLKEENVLYPMAENVLDAAAWSELAERLVRMGG